MTYAYAPEQVIESVAALTAERLDLFERLLHRDPGDDIGGAALSHAGCAPDHADL